MSPLELRHTIESGLLPLKSQTAIDGQGYLTVEIENTDGQRIVSEPVPIKSLDSSRAILNFIGSLRTSLAAPARRRRSGTR